jgi:NADH-quinone oxidoreductase subunit E
MAKVGSIVKKYPKGKQKSAILPLLDLAQRQNDGWLSVPAIECVADTLEIPYMRAYEVASFYTMFYLKPVGKHHVQICGTTPCWLRGSDEITKACEDHMGIKVGETTKDGKFTLTEVECLGACRNAPLVQINDDYFEDLDKDKMKEVLERL